MAASLGTILNDLISSINIHNPSGLIIIFFVVAVADIGFAFPVLFETFLFYTTYQVGPISLILLMVIIATTAGRQAGTAVLYWLSWLFGGKLNHWLHVHFAGFGERIDRFEKRLEKRPVITLTIARLTPGLLQVASITAGTVHLPYPDMILAALFSGFVYDGILIALGTFTRLGFSNLKPDDSIWIVLGFVGFLLLILIITSLLQKKRKDKTL